MKTIRHHGDPKKAVTLLGQEVRRVDRIFIPEYNAYVMTAPYDNHFVYANTVPEMSSYMCTCGSPAVVANPESMNARMLVCLMHASTGSHTNSS